MRQVAIAALAICFAVGGCDSDYGPDTAAPAYAHEHTDADHDHADHDDDAGSPPDSPHPITDKGVGPCTCADARLVNGWCRRCGLGYVADVPIASASLYEALDAHGHDFQKASIECQTCRSAIESEGFCDKCRMGFHGGLLYVSRLTHSMAKGEVVEPERTTCAVCRGPAGDAGWCEACGTGVVGNVAFRNKVDYQVATAEFRRLEEAISTLDRCEMCAIVMFTGGECLVCAQRAKDG